MFIYLKEEMGVYKFSDEFNSTCVQGYLNKEGIKTKQFIEDNLVNISDSADDIMIDEYENIAFFIDCKNLRISKLLSREIKENYDDVNIIWFGDINNYEEYLKCEYVDTVILENAEDVLLNIVKGEDLETINGISYIKNGEIFKGKVLDSNSKKVDIDDNTLSVKKEDSLYYKAMTNGITASITGFYPDKVIGNCSKHITVYKEELTSKDYEYLKDFLSLNSAVIHKTNSSKGYKENIELAEEGGCYLPHYHRVNTNETVKIDDTNLIKEVKFINYSKATNDLKDSYLRIETKEDIDSLLNDIATFKQTGTIKSYFVKNNIENECRWSFSGSCKLKNLVRFNVTEEGNINPCSGCKTCIGNIKDGYLSSVRNVYKHMDKTHISRECSKCELSDTCSKCSMLDNNMLDFDYCKIRRSNKEINDYFIKKNILNYLINGTNTFKDIDCEKVRFSTKFKTHLFTGEKELNEESIINPYICLIFVDETPILIELATGKLNKISKELAFIIEGLTKGFNKEEIKDNLFNIIDTKEVDKDEIVTSCINFLAQNGYIKEIV